MGPGAAGGLAASPGFVHIIESCKYRDFVGRCVHFI